MPIPTDRSAADRAVRELTPRQQRLYERLQDGDTYAGHRLLREVSTPTKATKAAHAAILARYRTRYGITVTHHDAGPGWSLIEHDTTPGTQRPARKHQP